LLVIFSNFINENIEIQQYNMTHYDIYNKHDFLSLSNEKSIRLFLNILEVFEDNIISTYKSKFVQFIIFLTCSRSTHISILFTRRLLHLFFDCKRSQLLRQSAIMYLASFVARATFLSQQLVR
jgi:hypothetical protein